MSYSLRQFLHNDLLSILFEECIDRFHVMFLSFIAYALHLLCYILKSLEYIDQFFACNHQQRTLDLSYCRAVPLISIVLSMVLVGVGEDVRVAEVRTLHIQVERNVYYFSFTCLVEIDVKFDSPLENEKDFLCIVTLLIEGVLRINFHRLEQRKDGE